MGQHNKNGTVPAPVALRTSSGSSTSRKRARVEPASSPSTTPAKQLASYSYHQDDYTPYESESWDVEPQRKKTKSDDGEKRLRRFRAKPPQSFHEIFARAVSQRFYVLSRTRCGTHWCPEEFLQITGSTGNVYNVTVAQQPTCDCPHARKGNQCKHVIFVLSRVLRAKHNYVYQLALLSEELRDIFDSAPLPVDEQAAAAGTDKQRKPVDGDCPICFEEMKTGSRSEALVWCKSACGQNIHRQCFEMWANTKRGSRAQVTCPYCRSKWEGNGDKVDLAKVKPYSKIGEDGYFNVADQLGISTQRDYSTYSKWWSGHPEGYRRRGRW